MSVRIVLACGCEAEEPHHFHELGREITEIWFDNFKILAQLGVGTLPTIGELDEEESNDDFMLVRIEPERFLAWLDALVARRAAIEEAFEPTRKRAQWKDVWELVPELRELGEHCRLEETDVEASHG